MSQSNPADTLSAVEADLGRVLAILHRSLGRLDDPARAGEVQSALRHAATLLESARRNHEQALTGQAPAPATVSAAHRVATGVSPEIAAVIAAAVAVLFDRPYRLVSVQPAAPTTPHLNVWALEGRTQIFQSHKVR